MRSSKKLHQMKNFDIDEHYKNEQTDRLMKERLEKKKNFNDIDDFRINYSLMRDPEIFQSIVITKSFQEPLESFLENCAITPLRGQDIGKIVYSFRVYNGASKLNWEIKKTLSEFELLFKSMIKYIYPDSLDLELDKWIPDFTALRQTEVSNAEETLDILDIFLDKLINQEKFRNMSELFDFFELSCIPTSRFIKRFKECYILKKSGGRYKEGICSKLSSFFCSRWFKRWFMVNEDGICYASSPEKNQAFLRETLLFDNSIKLIYGPKNTGSIYGLDIYTNTRKLVLKCVSLWSLYEMIESIERAIQKCAYIQVNRYMSFAPERKELSYCQWFVDGKNYYQTLYSALLDAENEIFIQDWWLSPEFYFHRPVSENKNQETRLDRVFKKLADKGVKIYIIVYKSPFVLTLDSNHTKNALEELSPNIKVIQHPGDFIFWWTHHEKLVIIDQKIGFLGGLDICHGRMDEKSHLLTDLGPNEYFHPGIDYANSRISDFKNVKFPETSHLNREKNPRMPWHDVGTMVIGLPVKDLARHFMQYWNFIKIDLADRKNLGVAHMQTVMDFKGEKDAFRKKQGSTEVGFFQGQTISNVEINITQFRKTKDHIKIKSNLNYEMENSCEANDSSVQEIPMIFSQNYWTKNDLDEQLKNSKTYLSTKKQPIKSRAESYFISENYNMQFRVMNSFNTLKNTLNASETNKGTNETKFRDLYKTISKRTINYDNNTMKSIKNVEEKKKIKGKKEKITEFFYEQNMLQMKYDHAKSIELYERYKPSCKCQIVRSASNWSCGLDDELMENSLQYAYIQLIEESKYYIYIENQFFISCLAGPPVENQIANALLLRILRANEENEPFKVFVALPLLPGFEGDIADKNSSVLRIQLYWQYETISRSKTSLLTSLEHEGIDPFEYILFFGLRTSGILENPITELIYIHSKIIIIDDLKVVIGSGNINDRSMLGDRDSEIAIVVEDTDLIFSVMNGEGFKAGRFPLNLRKALWKEFFEFTDSEMMDPLSEELWKKMKNVCQKNTEIYRKVFACYPDDNVKKISDLEKFYKIKNLDLYNEFKGEIKGYAVEFPLNFLCEENLKFTHLQKEYYAPDINFT